MPRKRNNPSNTMSNQRYKVPEKIQISPENKDIEMCNLKDREFRIVLL